MTARRGNRSTAPGRASRPCRNTSTGLPRPTPAPPTGPGGSGRAGPAPPPPGYRRPPIGPVAGRERSYTHSKPLTGQFPGLPGGRRARAQQPCTASERQAAPGRAGTTVPGTGWQRRVSVAIATRGDELRPARGAWPGKGATVDTEQLDQAAPKVAGHEPALALGAITYQVHFLHEIREATLVDVQRWGDPETKAKRLP